MKCLYYWALNSYFSNVNNEDTITFKKFALMSLLINFNPFDATGLCWYSLKASENQRFSDVFRGYRKRPVALNGLTHFNPVFHSYTPWNIRKSLTRLDNYLLGGQKFLNIL